MRCFLSGWQATNREREQAVIDTGALKYRCFSYGIIVNQPGMGKRSFVPNMIPAYELCLEKGIGIMMDSGAFSYRSWARVYRVQGKDPDAILPQAQFVDSYVVFCKENQHKWQIFFTLDLEVDAERVFQRHCELEQRGIRPAPVLHGDDNIVEYMRRYADRGYDLIGLGMGGKIHGNHTGAKRYLEAGFNEAAKHNIRIHGLGMTSAWQVMDFPFWSIDSSSWSRAASTGCILEFDELKNRIQTLHISDQTSAKNESIELSGIMMERVREHVEQRGFDFKLLQTDYVERHKWNAVEMDHMVDVATKHHARGKGSWNLLF
jgi:hypothetical protein